MTDQEYDELDLAVARAEIAAGQFVEISDAGRPTVRDADGLDAVKDDRQFAVGQVGADGGIGGVEAAFHLAVRTDLDPKRPSLRSSHLSLVRREYDRP